ncbi:hypothetical protein MMF96_07655 [Arthrobacter sp. STN4]|nr:hypothetical protein [Arthrobacter sp. STN4]MCQ9163934.1 hypothetical protein [Arthrobacter sp. STN4]
MAASRFDVGNHCTCFLKEQQVFRYASFAGTNVGHNVAARRRSVFQQVTEDLGARNIAEGGDGQFYFG